MNLETLRKLKEAGYETKRTFSFPHELVDDPSLTLRQKRALLAEWASDACAIESFPTLRLLPGTTFPVTLSSIMDALRKLDDGSEMEEHPDAPAFHWSGLHVFKRDASAHGENCVSYRFARGRETSAQSGRHALRQQR
jgi:hypothetical protein